jgi:F-box/leucine-rich repeat protein 2/20
MVSLDLSWCENLESEAIGKALRRMPSLRRALLRATKADSDTVSIIAKYCPYLVELNLARCDAIDDNALTALARAAEERSESFLRSLDLSWSLVSDTGLIPLLTISRHMEALGLQGCKSLSAGLVLYLLDDQRFPLHSSVAETVRSQNMTTRNESTGGAEMAGLHRERSPSPSVMAVGMAVPDLQFIDLSWVNMFHKDLAVRLSKARRHLKVVDYYNEVYENGKVIAEFI